MAIVVADPSLRPATEMTASAEAPLGTWSSHLRSSSSSDDELFFQQIQQWEEAIAEWEQEDEILACIYVSNKAKIAAQLHEDELQRRRGSTPGHAVINRGRIKGQHMHKNLLQDYTQRSGIPLPSYSIFNEGELHAPRFRATVLVDGMPITSPNTFSHVKEAGQDVAKLALECVSVKFKNEGSHYIHKVPVFCKLILNEYGAKLKIDKPTYNTTRQRGKFSTFVSTIVFDGKTYVGYAGKSKQEAEQYAACTVIDSILANSNACNAMAQIIKTKGKLFAAMDKNATVGNGSIRSGTESDGAHDVNRGLELVSVSNNGTLPVEASSCVPYTSPWVDVAHNNQMNYQIPSLGLPVAIAEPHAIIPQKRSKRTKKRRQGDQSKRVRVYEQPSASLNPANGQNGVS